MQVPVAYTLLFKLLLNELFLNYSTDLSLGYAWRDKAEIYEVLLMELRKAVIAVVDQVGPVLGFVSKSEDVIISLKVHKLRNFL